jgi:Tfp pilus assembly pilus retraction ATPase PilT
VLSGCLIGVIRQELLPRKDGKGFMMVHDTLLATEQTRKLIEEGNWGALDNIASLASREGDPNFSSMRSEVEKLVRAQVVDHAVAAQVVGMRKASH